MCNNLSKEQREYGNLLSEISVTAIKGDNRDIEDFSKELGMNVDKIREYFKNIEEINPSVYKKIKNKIQF